MVGGMFARHGWPSTRNSGNGQITAIHHPHQLKIATDDPRLISIARALSCTRQRQAPHDGPLPLHLKSQYEDLSHRRGFRIYGRDFQPSHRYHVGYGQGVEAKRQTSVVSILWCSSSMLIGFEDRCAELLLGPGQHLWLGRQFRAGRSCRAKVGSSGAEA